MPSRSKERKSGRPVTSLQLAEELRRALAPWSSRYRVEVWSGYEKKDDPFSPFLGEVYVKFSAVAPDSRVDEAYAPRSVFFVVHGPTHTPSTDFILELARVRPTRKISPSERHTSGDADFVIEKIVEAVGKAAEGASSGRSGRASGSAMLRIGAHFAGIGGLELGLEEAFRAAGYGAETVYQIELSDYSRAVLAKHWPRARRYADIGQVDPRALPAIDVCSIGFPCTDLSTAGKGAGIEYGQHSSLWRYSKEILRVQAPPLVVIENINQGRQRWLPTVFRDLEGLGYRCRAHRVAASDLGAPHERARCFVVATHADGVSLRHLAERLPRRRTGLLRRPWEGLSPHDGVAWFSTIASRWAASPRLHGVDDGLPTRLDEDRLKAIGNAVSPPVAYAVGLEVVRRFEKEAE